MTKNNFFISIIVVLMFIVLFQRSTPPPKPPLPPTVDTVITEITVHDTVFGKPVFIKAKKDTVWKDSIQYKPDTTYIGLLKQYDSVLDRYFSRNMFKTEYELGKFGRVQVIDTIVANKIVGNSMTYSITIPEKTITITKFHPPVRQFYLGGGLFGSKETIIKTAQVGLLYKDRKDRIFIGSVGFDNQVVYGVQSYWKIKL